MFRSRAMMYLVLFVLHLFIGISLIGDLGLGLAGQLPLWALLILSFVLVPLGFRSRDMNSRLLAWAALIAMGVFSSLAVFSLLRGVMVALASLVGHPLDAAWRAGSAWVVLGLVLLVALRSVYNARRTAKVKEVELALPTLPAGLEGLRIVQLSDLHIGPTIKAGYLQRIVERVNGLDADLVAITGDLVDGSVAELRLEFLPLQQLKARLGTYAITGNHEYYSGAKAWVRAWREQGLTLLIDEHRVLQHQGTPFVLAGITDYSAPLYVPSHRSDAAAAFAGAPEGLFRLLLAHQPRSAPKAEAAGADLQLSGHTHGGQFWPWMHFVRLQQPWVAGIHRLGRLTVYISRGTGYWGPPLRFGAPSEITLIRLRRG